MEGWKLDTPTKICPNTNNTAVDCEEEFTYNMKTLSRQIEWTHKRSTRAAGIGKATKGLIVLTMQLCERILSVWLKAELVSVVLAQRRPVAYKAKEMSG